MFRPGRSISSIISLINKMARIIIGLFVILIGINVLTGISLFQFAFAALLIYFGFYIMFGRKKSGWNMEERSSSTEDVVNEVAIFSPIYRSVTSKEFKGGRLVMIFAGGELDLSEVKTDKKEVVMEVTAIFGGGKLIVPKEWKVRSEGTAIFGGYDIRTGSEAEGPVLILKGAAIFGGIEVVNG